MGVITALLQLISRHPDPSITVCLLRTHDILAYLPFVRYL